MPPSKWPVFIRSLLAAFNRSLTPAEGPKLESILETDVPDKYTLTDHLWN